MAKARTHTVDGHLEPAFKGKRLTMPGLKPSDWFLFKSMRVYFNYDMRELLVLGLRYLYSNAHDPAQREKITALANIVHAEDLDIEVNRPTYRDFATLMKGD